VAAGWIWVADAGDSDVVQIDPSTGTVVRTIAVGSDPNAIAASPTGDAVWVANTGSGTVFRIDTATSTVTAAQAVGPAPTGIAVDGRNVWVAVSGADQVVQLDPTTATITDTIAMSGSPRSIALTDGRVAVTTSAPAGSHRGGTLHVLIPGTISDTADPTYSEWYYGGIWALTNDALVARARVGGPGGLVYVPDLAIAVPDAQDGGRTWTFRLRPGLVYSDGRPVRASDALGSFERAVLAGNAAQTGAGMFRDTSIVGSAACGTAPPCDLSAGITTDDAAGTITFHLVAPVGDFPTRIGSVPIVPAGTPLTLSPVPLVATGPYMVAAFISGTREELVRNPRFSEWSHDAQPDGEVDTMEFEGTNDPDPTTTVLAGTADVLTVGAEPAGRLASIATQEPAQLRITPSNQVWDEAMNTTLAPFDDQDVRQAVNLATDRAALVDAWGGPLTATITCQVLPSGFAGFQRYCPWTVDPSSNGNWLGPDVPRAQALIAAAGVRGQAVTVWGLDGDGQHAAVARYFTGLLTSLGFRATMHLLPYDQYFSFIAEHPEQVQMAGYWDESAERTAAEAIPGAFTCPADPGYPYNGQPSEWCDPSVDAQVQSAEALESSDPIAADDEWARIDRSIVDAAPGVLAFDPTSVTLLSARTGGYEYDPVLGVLYGDLWVR
jgi:peptide/nickel transport system substrate-binding protein